MPPIAAILLLCITLALGSLAGALMGLLSAAAATVLALLAGLGLALALYLGSSQPGLQLFGPARSRGPQGQRVSLTFDDGPHPESTPALLAALREHDARATFFVLVDQAEAHPELMRAIAAEHEVGLHGLGHHPWIALWSPRRGAAELSEALRRLGALVEQPVRWYRPPFGVTSPRLVRAVQATGLETIWCSLRTLDGVGGSEERLRRSCQRARGGDILLLHEGPRPARAALPAILEDLTSRGLRSVTVGELLENP